MSYSKTPFFGTLRKALAMAFVAEENQLTAEEVIQREEEARLSRRKFLENSGKAALGLGLAATLPNSVLANAVAKPKVVIVGAGMAGLNAMHTLKKAGYEVKLYEASKRTSGRIMSVQGAMGEGTWAEFGAEFIDTNHADMWTLAKEFNLELIDYAQASEAKLTAEAFYFEGRHRTLVEVVTEFRKFAPQMKKDMDSLPETIDYQTKDPIAVKFDNMSLSDYLTSIGATGWIKRFITVAYESEYGLAATEQSSLNLLLLISPDTESGHIDLFGESDERYKTRGGNQSIPDALGKKYADSIEFNCKLMQIQKVGKFYGLTFFRDDKSLPVLAEVVILAIPFTTLRKVINKVPMPQQKLDCINKLSYGTNAKLMLGMKSHFWRKQGFGGLVYADNGVPNGWDNAQLQTGEDQAAGLSILFGGPEGLQVGEGSKDAQRDKYLPLWEQIYKGATEQHNGNVHRMVWGTHPFNLGSYICYTKGQYTTLSGLEATPVDNIFFAGEHCGGEFAGFMNGAAKSGREAAELIIEKFK